MPILDLFTKEEIKHAAGNCLNTPIPEAGHGHKVRYSDIDERCDRILRQLDYLIRYTDKPSDQSGPQFVPKVFGFVTARL